VNADVPNVEVMMLSEQDDRIDPAGVQGAWRTRQCRHQCVCNAIFHGTGQPFRKLPVRLENLQG
jgi:xanthine dehydrogenase YagR molybdenum-binding subunit